MTSIRIITMKTKLLQLKMEDFQTILTFKSKIKELQKALALKGNLTSSLDMVIRLLAKLPWAFDTLFSLTGLFAKLPQAFHTLFAFIVTLPCATMFKWKEVTPIIMHIDGKVSTCTTLGGGDVALPPH